MAQPRRGPPDAATALQGAPAAAARNRYVDLIRLGAIAVVVLGHWLDTTIRIEDGYPVGESALASVGYMRWLTLLLQIMPLFFLAGGFAAAASWTSWRNRGGGWAGWLYGRCERLLRPTNWFIAAMTTAAIAAWALGAPPGVLDQAGWAVALQLWFLAAYLPLLVLAAPLLTAWTRWRWRLFVAAFAVVAVLDVLVRVAEIRAIGWLSLLIVPAAGFALGMAWWDGALARRGLLLLMALGGLLLLLVLILGLGYPPWMIGVPGEPPANTNPPNLALMAYAATQIGIVLLLQPRARRLLQRPVVWRGVVRGNSVIMSLYLWHMVPVLVVGALVAVLGLPTGPATGTLPWWLLRVVWFAVLGLMLAGIVAVVGRLERPGRPRPELAGRLPTVLLLVGTAAAVTALSRLALEGFAPDGHPAFGPVLLYGAGATVIRLACRLVQRS